MNGLNEKVKGKCSKKCFSVAEFNQKSFPSTFNGKVKLCAQSCGTEKPNWIVCVFQNSTLVVQLTLIIKVFYVQFDLTVHNLSAILPCGLLFFFFSFLFVKIPTHCLLTGILEMCLQ